MRLDSGICCHTHYVLAKKQTIQTQYQFTIQLTTTIALLYTRQKVRQRTTHTAQTGDVKVERTSVLYTKGNEPSLCVWLQTRKHKTFPFALPPIYNTKI